MVKNADKLAHAINMLVGLASIASAEGWLAKAAIATSSYFSARDLFRHDARQTTDLAVHLLQTAQHSLAALRHDKPDDAELLLADMINDAMPTLNDLVANDLTADSILKLMHKTLDDKNLLPDYNTDAMRGVFSTIVGHCLKTLLNDANFNATLAPQINQAILTRLTDISNVVRAMEQHYGSIAKSLDELRRLNLLELQTLARLFEIPDALDLEEPELREALTLKTQEYQALKSEVDAIKENNDSLANMKAAAKHAIEHLDFAEVENLLSMVQTAKLEVAAQTAKLRAHNALMRGRGAQAFTLLSSTADSFGAADPLAPIHKRLEFALTFYHHGLRYGGQGLDLAIQMNRDALQRFDSKDQPQLWAQAQNNLANALQNIGSRTGGEAGNQLLTQAVTAYRDILQVRTQAAFPVQWAMTQNNLAVALCETGSRTDGEAGNQLLTQAVTAYRDALQVRTQAAFPVQWAMTQNNLANALQETGIRTGGEAGSQLLTQAVTAYRDALQVRTQAAHPVQWAMTQENLALVYQAMAQQQDCLDPTAELQTALKHLDAALTEFDPIHMPYNHTKAIKLRDEIIAALAK